jgi:hypothetical protein
MLKPCERGCGGSLTLHGDGEIRCSMCNRGPDPSGENCATCGCVSPPGCVTHRVGAGSGRGSIFSVCDACPTSRGVQAQNRKATAHIDRSNPKQRERQMVNKAASG